jgi:hypothetical protein
MRYGDPRYNYWGGHTLLAGARMMVEIGTRWTAMVTMMTELEEGRPSFRKSGYPGAAEHLEPGSVAVLYGR